MLYFIYDVKTNNQSTSFELNQEQADSIETVLATSNFVLLRDCGDGTPVMNQKFFQK